MVVLSVFWVVGGLIQTIGSIVERDEHWVLELFSGLLSVAAGVVAVVWPGGSLKRRGPVRLSHQFGGGSSAPSHSVARPNSKSVSPVFLLTW